MTTLAKRSALFERVERATEVPMLLLSLVFLIAVGAPEVLELSESWLVTLDGITWVVWGAFAFELVVKVYLAPDRRGYLIAHWMDVVTVLVPFLRPLRLLRLLAIGIRFWTEARTVLRERTLEFIGTASLLTVGVTAGLVYLAERGGDGPIQNFPDALWWAAATITTVGYGDVYPKTAAGRGVAVFLMLVGISLFGVLTARVAAFFVEGHKHADHATIEEILERLKRIEASLAANEAPPAADADAGSLATTRASRDEPGQDRIGPAVQPSGHGLRAKRPRPSR
jgi:voltage-gated potassium channel